MAKNGAAKKAPAKSKGNVVVREEKLDLPVGLTEKEDSLRRKALEEAQQQIAKLKDDAAVLRKQARGFEAERDRLIKIVTEKQELRPTRVRKEIDFDRDEVRLTRLDTGVLYERREIDDEERQGELDDYLPPRTGGNGVSDKPPKGEAGKKLVGQTKKGDVEKPAAPTPEAAGWPDRPKPMWDDGAKG